MNAKIPIVFITDDNYAMPSAVSITSLLKNKNPKTGYKIYILGINLSDENIKTLKTLEGVEVLDLENKYENLKTIDTYVSKAAFFKFDLANIFSQYDKILYLDSDTLILNDLSNLFNEDISNVYGGVVKDCVGEVLLSDTKRLNIDAYFNSGVMLLNTKKMREDNIKEKLLQKKQASPPDYLDQEVFNTVFKNNVKYLHPKFNYMITNSKLSKGTLKAFYNTKEIRPEIIHLTYLKPWEYKGVKYFRLWKKYYKLSPFKDKKLVLKNNPDKFRLFKKRKYSDRWVVDFLGLRFSYKKGGKDLRFFYP